MISWRGLPLGLRGLVYESKAHITQVLQWQEILCGESNFKMTFYNNMPVSGLTLMLVSSDLNELFAKQGLMS